MLLEGCDYRRHPFYSAMVVKEGEKGEERLVRMLRNGVYQTCLIETSWSQVVCVNAEIRQ